MGQGVGRIVRYVSIPEGAIEGPRTFVTLGRFRFVSIPEGAIEGCWRLRRWRLRCWVSIPEGAIEGASFSFRNKVFIKFQYPKVRLKEALGSFLAVLSKCFNTRRCD